MLAKRNQATEEVMILMNLTPYWWCVMVETLRLFLIETQMTALPLKSVKSQSTAVRVTVDKEILVSN